MMPSRSISRVRLRCFLAVLAVPASLFGASDLSAQVMIVRGPCANAAAAAFSIPIFEQAELLRAEARLINAEAYSKEMDNEVKRVSTFFERRRLNREGRDAEHTDFLEHQEKYREQQSRIIRANLDDALGADLSDELNFMLRELMRDGYSLFMSRHPDSLIGSPDNIPLSADDRHQIRVSEGKVAGGGSLVFRVDKAQVLETQWPMTLLEERFDVRRDAFEEARESALGDLKIVKEVTRDSRTRLMNAVDQLTAELTAYLRERRKSLSPRDLLEYVEAVGFLRSLDKSTYRLIKTQGTAAFDESYRFQGKNVGELLQHLVQKGLEFAPAEPGGEVVYRKVYDCMRTFYLQLVPEAGEKDGK